MQHKRIKQILDQDAVLLIHGFIGILFLFETIFFSSHKGLREILIVVVSCCVWALIGAVKYFNLLSVNKKPYIYLTIYHVAFGLFFALYEKPYSPYLLIWLIIGYLTHRYYGMRGLTVTIGVNAIVLLNQSFRALPADTNFGEYFRFIGIQMLVFAMVSLYFSLSGKLSADDKNMLASSIDKAQLERQRLISLINSMGDGVISTDDKGVIKLYNAAALNILDTNKSLQDRHINEVATIIDQSAKVVDLISEATEKNSAVTSTDHMLVYPDGEKINLYVSVSPIKLSFRQNTERGFILSFRDITHEKSLEEERNEFISVVSHELRTPIAITEANISNAQFIVEKGNNLAAVKTALEASHKQALFLANMINDLSTLSRAERGKLDLKTETVDPREIMGSLNDDYQKDAQSKGLEFLTEVLESTPLSIVSNRLYIREILQNFVTNSIKYTKSGSVKVTVSGVDGGIVFAVKDTGIGISKSDQKRVFDKFFRSEDFRTRESSGTGLGLYVTRKLMNLINAKVELKSKLNEGSTFSVRIPDLEMNSPKITK